MLPVQQHIINLLISGENLRSIHRLEGETMPTYREIILWLNSKEEHFKEFQDEYYRIQKLRAHLIMEDVMDVVHTMPQHRLPNPKGEGTIMDPGFLAEAKFKLSHMRTMLLRFSTLTAIMKKNLNLGDNDSQHADQKKSEAKPRLVEFGYQFPEILFSTPLDGFDDDEIEEFPEYEEEDTADCENIPTETSSHDRDAVHCFTTGLEEVAAGAKLVEVAPVETHDNASLPANSAPNPVEGDAPEDNNINITAKGRNSTSNLTTQQCDNSPNNSTQNNETQTTPQSQTIQNPKKTIPVLISKMSTFLPNGTGGWQDLGISYRNTS
jgi:hypothetical protein